MSYRKKTEAIDRKASAVSNVVLNSFMYKSYCNAGNIHYVINIALLVFVFISTFLFSQQTNAQQKQSFVPPQLNKLKDGGNCGSDILLSQLRKDPEFKKREAKMNQEIFQYNRTLDDTIITLPVVVHIINNNPASITDQQVSTGIQDLNDAFSKAGPYAASAGVDTRIRFCLAKKDPDGGATTGITRTTYFYSTHSNTLIEEKRLKNLIQWDPAKYINIWLISSMDYELFPQFSCGQWLRMNAEGYATMPPNGGPLDGIVVKDFGQLLAHEMGHYLGLYHTFEGMDCRNNDCALDGDRVCDTPPDASVRNSFSCSSPENSCTTDTFSGFKVDIPDQIANFMDYGNNACHNQFTQGQADRMRAAINTQRTGLLQDECTSPCISNMQAAFTRNNAYPTPGTTVAFTNNSIGAISYEWLVDGIVVAKSTNFSYTFNNIGKTKVTLKAYNNTACFASYTEYVTVTCGVTARFYTDKRVIASKDPLYVDSIHFINTSENATSYQWIMSNDAGMAPQVVSTDKDFTYIFKTPGNYTIKLVATNGSCTDETEQFPMLVYDPTPDLVSYVFNADCYQETKVRLNFFVCNYGFITVPPNIPVTLYDADPTQAGAKKLGTFYTKDSILGGCCSSMFTEIIELGRRKVNKIYIVVNDAGTTIPLTLPNTSFLEKDYGNNTGIIQNFAFVVTPSPTSATMEPGDTLKLTAITGRYFATSYLWSPAYNLSCNNCQSPLLIADTNAVSRKQVIATSNYGCTDTGSVTILVPPYNDYTIRINEMECVANDSIFIKFTVYNSFKRAVIPRGLTIAFYNGNPATAGATFLPSLFRVTDTIPANQATFTTVVKAMQPGRLYAVVNDSARRVPVIFPTSWLLEKTYTNNFFDTLYAPEKVIISPSDTTVFRKQPVTFSILNTIYNAASTLWTTSSNAFNCYACLSPTMTVLNNAVINVKTENKFKCVINGATTVKIFPPDMTVKILDTKCYTNNVALVTFSICMNNGYDSTFSQIPVSFYDGNPAIGGKLLSVFITPSLKAGDCNTYTTRIISPTNSKLTAVVNDKGNGGQVPVKQYDETTYTNNFFDTSYVQFEVSVYPSDTAIKRLSSVLLQPVVKGGTLTTSTWTPSQFLSCTTCATPVATPEHTMQYQMLGRNEYACTDTGIAIVRTETTKGIFIPDAFTPNGDQLNDAFYVMAGTEVSLVKEFSIFNRWGQKMFQVQNVLPNNPANGWRGLYNGKEVPNGTYIYYIVVDKRDGTSEFKKGTVVLIR